MKLGSLFIIDTLLLVRESATLFPGGRRGRDFSHTFTYYSNFFTSDRKHFGTLEKASPIISIIVRYGKLIFDRLETPLTRPESANLTASNRQLSYLRSVVPVS